MFQSTHPHGVRPRQLASYLLLLLVSIHAPAWGATLSVLYHLINLGFNPRTRMGCDKQDKDAYTKLYMFQSTHPHGVRPSTEVKK